MGKLDEKVVIVTGSSRGIGANISKLLADEGGRVVCAARTLREGEHPLKGALESTVASIRSKGGEAQAVAVDISTPEGCEHLVRETHSAYGPVDVLVNNAVVTHTTLMHEYPLNRWMRSWAVNLHAPFILSRLALEDMIPRRDGSIVNISSGGAIGPGRGPYHEVTANRLQGYGAQKAALERMTQGMAMELYEHGVSVACVSPSQLVPSPGTVYHGLARGMDDPNSEPQDMMPRAVLLLATEPLDKVTGRVTYSQEILKEFGWIEQARGRGIDPDRPVSGYSRQ